MESKLTRREQTERKDKILSSIKWLNRHQFPIYMRNGIIGSIIKLAGLQHNYLYAIFNWSLHLNCCETQIRSLIDCVDNIVEKKKNNDIKNIFIAHDLWFNHNPGVAMPWAALTNQSMIDMEFNELGEFTELDMSGIENFAAISSI